MLCVCVLPLSTSEKIYLFSRNLLRKLCQLEATRSLAFRFHTIGNNNMEGAQNNKVGDTSNT
jgi:hypothetical protein